MRCAESLALLQSSENLRPICKWKAWPKGSLHLKLWNHTNIMGSVTERERGTLDVLKRDTCPFRGVDI